MENSSAQFSKKFGEGTLARDHRTSSVGAPNVPDLVAIVLLFYPVWMNAAALATIGPKLTPLSLRYSRSINDVSKVPLQLQSKRYKF